MGKLAGLLFAILLCGIPLMLEVPTDQVGANLAGYIQKSGHPAIAAWVRGHQFDWFMASLPVILFGIGCLIVALLLCDIVMNHIKPWLAGSKRRIPRRLIPLGQAAEEAYRRTRAADILHGKDYPYMERVGYHARYILRKVREGKIKLYGSEHPSEVIERLSAADFILPGIYGADFTTWRRGETAYSNLSVTKRDARRALRDLEQSVKATSGRAGSRDRRHEREDGKV